MTVKLKIHLKEVVHEHFKYLLTRFTEEVDIPPNPDFVDALAWVKCLKLYMGSNSSKFEGFSD